VEPPRSDPLHHRPARGKRRINRGRSSQAKRGPKKLGRSNSQGTRAPLQRYRPSSVDPEYDPDAHQRRDDELDGSKLYTRLPSVAEASAYVHALDGAVMGRQRRDQGRLFYEFRLEDRISENHLQRRINVFATVMNRSNHSHFARFENWSWPSSLRTLG